MYQVKKKGGAVEQFELVKVIDSIQNAFKECGRAYQESIIEMIAIKAIADAEKNVSDNVLESKSIKSSIGAMLSNYGYQDVSKKYLTFGVESGSKQTLIDYKKVMEGYLQLSDWRVKENASVGYSLGGLILSNSGAVTANYWLTEVYDKQNPEISQAHRNCDIHIHDLSMMSAYCFTGDTVVPTPQSKGDRTFEQLVNDGVSKLLVYSYDTELNQVVVAKAENPRITRYVDELVYVTLDDDFVIKCTKDHPFMLKDGTYKSAIELIPDTPLKPFLDEQHIVKLIDVIKLDSPVPVYDLTVPKYHNFLIDGNVFVHNCAGWSLKTLIKEGFNGVAKKTSSKPAKHLSTLCNHIINFLGCSQNEWSG